MNPGYLFISNSSKPTKEQAELFEYKIGTFELAPIEAAKSMGYSLFMGVNRSHPEKVKCADYDIKFYDQHSYRSIFAIKDNWKAYKNLSIFLKQHPEIEVIHCNTPIGGFMGRICGKKYGIKTIIYTAHGFHFFKGAPLFNRTILKCVEKYLARWTDAIITMNNEDYDSAQSFHLRNNGKVYKVPGVGVYTKSYIDFAAERTHIRKNLGIPKDAIVCLAMGDIVPRKNYKTAIEAIALCNNSKLHYLICGSGTQINELKLLSSKLGISSQIHFLGFRTDIKELSFASDFFLFASLQEGLPRSTMEAMCAGLPCIVSDIRGNNDLIVDGMGGFLAPPQDSSAFAKAICKFVSEPQLWASMSTYNKEIIKNYDIEVVKAEMIKIYKNILEKRNQI